MVVTEARTKGTPRTPRVSGERLQAMFDARARHYLGISGEEFLRQWDAGEYRDCDSTPILRLAMLLPLVR